MRPAMVRVCGPASVIASANNCSAASLPFCTVTAVIASQSNRASSGVIALMLNCLSARRARRRGRQALGIGRRTPPSVPASSCPFPPGKRRTVRCVPRLFPRSARGRCWRWQGLRIAGGLPQRPQQRIDRLRERSCCFLLLRCFGVIDEGSHHFRLADVAPFRFGFDPGELLDREGKRGGRPGSPNHFSIHALCLSFVLCTSLI